MHFFSFPIKPATVVWIGFMNKRGKFPYFGLYSPWSCAPGPLETGSSVVPHPHPRTRFLTLFESRGSGGRQITPNTLLPPPPIFGRCGVSDSETFCNKGWRFLSSFLTTTTTNVMFPLYSCYALYCSPTSWQRPFSS